MSSNQAQLKSLEKDSLEYKNVNRQYRDQLVKVKVLSMQHLWCLHRTETPLLDGRHG